MARPRKNHQRPPSPSSSKATNNQNNKQTITTKGKKGGSEEHRETLENIEPDTTMEIEEEKLDLGTDEDSGEEDANTEKENNAWTQVTNQRKKGPKQITQVSLIETGTQVNNPQPPLIQLNMEDVEEGIEYWANSIFCYILGANPPWTVVQGFAQRVWKGKIEQVSFMPNGIFLVRFKTKEDQQEAILNDGLLFDSKPVIIEEWTPSSSLIKKEVKEIPIWVKLRKLELRFWGERCFTKLVSGVGRYLECDKATTTKQFLGYAKVKVMVKLDQHFPRSVEFMDEMGQKQSIGLDYDWLPVTCTSCKNIGHVQGECRKGKNKPAAPKKAWQPKETNANPKGETTKGMDEGEVTADQSNSLKISTPRPKDHRTDSISKDGGQNDTPEPTSIFQMGGTSFLDKLTLSIKRDLTKQAELEAGASLLHG